MSTPIRFRQSVVKLSIVVGVQGTCLWEKGGHLLTGGRPIVSCFDFMRRPQ